MSVVLVDDRDGRIVAELETAEEIERIVEAWAKADGSIPDYLSLVETRSHHGAVIGTDSTVRVRPAGLGGGTGNAPTVNDDDAGRSASLGRPPDVVERGG
jgi:hypothetical protein